MSSGVDAWLKWLAGIVAVMVGLPVLFLYGMYWYGAKDLPDALPTAARVYSEDLRQMYWRVEHGGQGKPTIRARGPVGTVIAIFRSADRRHPDPSLSLTGQAARRVLLPLHRGFQGQWHLRSAAAAIRLSQERSADELIDLMLDRSYFPGGAHGIDAAAKAHYGVPLEALSREEALALVATMKSPSSFSPQCGGGFERRYLWLAQQQGLPAIDALAAARRRLRPLPCRS